MKAGRGALLAGKKNHYWGVQFTAEEAQSTIAFVKTGGSMSTPYLDISYDDGKTWEQYAAGSTITLQNIGDSVCFAASAGRINATFGNTYTGSNSYWTFSMTGKIAASGDLRSMIQNDKQLVAQRSLYVYQFQYFFYNCTALTTPPDLPATQFDATAPGYSSSETHNGHQYSHMFDGCSSLRYAPALPATQMTWYCYYYMFYRCRALTAPPDLPATSLATACYAYMFYITGITYLPKMLAQTGVSSAYKSMFQSCTSLQYLHKNELSVTDDYMFQQCTNLKTAPYLPVTASSQMFYGCTSLNTIKVGFTSWPSCTSWTSGVAANGVFYCKPELGTNETIERGVNRCPENWIVGFWGLKFTAQQTNTTIKLIPNGNNLPDVQLEMSTDNGFTWQSFTIGQSGGATLSNVGDTLCIQAADDGNPAFAQSESSYYSFSISGRAAASGNLDSIRYNLFTATNMPLTQYCYCKLFYGCSGLTSSPNLNASQLTPHCYESMFTNCTSLTQLPTMNQSAILADSCYKSMFSGCTAIEAVELLHDVLAPNCYQSMFSGCSSLSSVFVMFKSWGNSNSTLNWLSNVSQTGSFTCLTDLGTPQSIERGQSRCPTNWNVVNLQQTAVEWIKSDGQSYIELPDMLQMTGKTVSEYQGTIIVEFTNVVDTTAQTVVSLGRQSTLASGIVNTVRVGINNPRQPRSLWVYYGGTSLYKTPTALPYGSRVTVSIQDDATNAVMTLNSSETATKAKASAYLARYTAPMRILCGGTSDSTGWLTTEYFCTSAQLHHVTWLDGSGNTIIDLSPIRIGTTAYLKDNVSGQLFGNSAQTGSILYGPDAT